MTLAEVLALHPGEGADAATLAAAVADAESRRDELLKVAAEAEQVRAAGLLTVDDKKLQAAERDAVQARLAAHRIDAVLPSIRASLGAARGEQSIADLKGMVPAVTESSAALAKWWAEEWPKMARTALAGMRAYSAARDARQAFLSKVETAFVSQDTRSAAPDGLDVTLPPQPNNPASLFLLWDFRNV